MKAGMRKLVLTTHLTCSVGWIGAVAGFLALVIAGLASPDPPAVRSAHFAANLIIWIVIVPLSFGSPLTRLVPAPGTPWGPFRHYWVLATFLLKIFATTPPPQPPHPVC